MVKFFWGVTLIVSVVAALLLVGGLVTANGAPQEAAIGADVAAICIIPYVFTRAAEGLSKNDEARASTQVSAEQRAKDA